MALAERRWRTTEHSDGNDAVLKSPNSGAAISPNTLEVFSNGPNVNSRGQLPTDLNGTDQSAELLSQAAVDSELREPEVPGAEGVTANPLLRLIYAIAGGTGASISSQASVFFRADLLRRMRLQDTAVMLLMVAVYYMTLLVTASVTYRQAANSSRVTYYADPRYHSAALEGSELEAFLESFAQPPKNVHLHVAGLAHAIEDVPGTLQYRGGNYRVDFTFALDISPWVVRESSMTASSGSGTDALVLPLEDGIVADDLDELRRFLGRNTNDLATIQLEKEISWPRWEELATNIKHQIRQCDYDGVLGIDRTRHETINVYKNKQWANFMHSRTLKVVLALSIVGWVFYLPYMWLRSTSLRVRCLYQVSIGIGDYWQLIADRLCAQGFEPFESSAFGRRPLPLLWPQPSPDDRESFYDPQEEDSDF